MNGKKCKTLRGMNRHSRKAYRLAKRDMKAANHRKAQRPKLATERQRKRPQPIAPTWPKTEDQHAQSRPVIVVRRYLPGQSRLRLE